MEENMEGNIFYSKEQSDNICNTSVSDEEWNEILFIAKVEELEAKVDLEGELRS